MKKIQKLNLKQVIRQKYLTHKKELKTSLISAKKQKNEIRIKQLKQQLLAAKIDYRKKLKALKPANKPKKIKQLTPKQIIRQKYLTHKKELKTSLVSAKEQKNEARIKQLKQQLLATKLNFRKELKALKPTNKFKKTNQPREWNKQIIIYNFNIASLTISITCIFILIIFALIGAANIVPEFQIVVFDGKFTAFGIVFILLMMIIIGLLISNLVLYIFSGTHKQRETKDSSKPKS